MYAWEVTPANPACLFDIPRFSLLGVICRHNVSSEYHRQHKAVLRMHLSSWAEGVDSNNKFCSQVLYSSYLLTKASLFKSINRNRAAILPHPPCYAVGSLDGLDAFLCQLCQPHVGCAHWCPLVMLLWAETSRKPQTGVFWGQLGAEPLKPKLFLQLAAAGIGPYPDSISVPGLS